MLGMQGGLNSVSMAAGVMEKALYSSYTLYPEALFPQLTVFQSATATIYVAYMQLNGAIDFQHQLPRGRKYNEETH